MMTLIRINGFFIDVDYVFYWRSRPIIKRLWFKIPKPYFYMEQECYQCSTCRIGKFRWKCKLAFHNFSKLPVFISNETLIKSIKEAMKEISNPIITYSKDLKPTPKEKEETRKRISKDGIESRDYRVLEMALTKLTNNEKI